MMNCSAQIGNNSSERCNCEHPLKLNWAKRLNPLPSTEHHFLIMESFYSPKVVLGDF